MHHRCLGVTSGCARGFKISNSKCGFDRLRRQRSTTYHGRDLQEWVGSIKCGGPAKKAGMDKRTGWVQTSIYESPDCDTTVDRCFILFYFTSRLRCRGSVAHYLLRRAPGRLRTPGRRCRCHVGREGSQSQIGLSHERRYRPLARGGWTPGSPPQSVSPGLRQNPRRHERSFGHSRWRVAPDDRKSQNYHPAH